MPTRALHRLIARLTLAWFALALGVAAASPLVQPRAMQLVCSAQGTVKLLFDAGDGPVETGAHTLDCALCLTANAPPPVAPAPALRAPAPLLRLVSAGPADASIAAPSAAPPPARGPPRS